MGTRALIHVHVEGKDSDILTTIYRQFDGYPDGLGEDIKEALGGKEVVNGYSDPDNQVNGMGCAAAMLVGALKEGKCGNVYLYAPGTKDVWEDYTYDLYRDGPALMLSVNGGALYAGPLSDFDASKLDEEAA
jgi:hypothetical protein